MDTAIPLPRAGHWIHADHTVAQEHHPLTHAPSLGLHGRFLSEWRALSQERDPEIFAQGMLVLAGRLEQAGETASAASVYAGLLQGSPHPGSHPTPDQIRRRARQRLDALQGKGAMGARAEVLLRDFSRQALDPSLLIGMTAASTVFRLTRVATLARMSGAWRSTFFTPRLTSGALAFSAEAVTFPLAARLVSAAMGREIAWGPGLVGREIASSFILLGGMRLAGLGMSLGMSLVARGSSLGGWPKMVRLPGALRQVGILGGILLGHGMEEELGLRERREGATTLTDSLAMLLQFQVAGRAARGIFGEGPREYEPVPESGERGKWLTLPSFEIFQPASDGGRPRSHGQALQKFPTSILMSSPENSDPPAGGGAYRDPADPLGSHQQAMARLKKELRTIRDSSQDPVTRVTLLKNLSDYYYRLSEEESLGVLKDIFQIMADPQLPRPKEATPEALQTEHPDELPEVIGAFYMQEWEIRRQAVAQFTELLPRILWRRQDDLIKWMSSVRKMVEDPKVPTYFRPRFRKKLWRQVYGDAVFAVRRELVKTYLALLPRLEGGKEEAYHGAILLSRDYLFDPLPMKEIESVGLSRGDQEFVLNLTRIYAGLQMRIPGKLHEMRQAWVSIRRLAKRIRAQAGEDPEALKVLVELAHTDLPSKERLRELAREKSPGAEEGLTEVERYHQQIREEFGDRSIKPYYDTRLISVSWIDDIIILETLARGINWVAGKLGRKKKDPPPDAK